MQRTCSNEIVRRRRTTTRLKNSFEFYLGEALNMQKIICGFIASDGCRFIRTHSNVQTHVYNFIMHVIIHSSEYIKAIKWIQKPLAQGVAPMNAILYVCYGLLISFAYSRRSLPFSIAIFLMLVFVCDKNGNIHPSSNNTNLTVIIHHSVDWILI